MKFFKKKHLLIYKSNTFKNSISQIHKGLFCVCFQQSGLLTFLQFKALIFFLKKKLKFYSKLYLRLNLTFKMTKKPIGVRMGKGKGNLDLAYAFITKGQIFFEFGFKKQIFTDILNYKNIFINIQNLHYFNKKVATIIRLASAKLKMKLQLYKKFN